MSNALKIAAGMIGGAASITYATWNPLDKDANYALSNEDRTVTRIGGDGNTSLRATLPKTAGKWYVEMVFPSGLSGQDGAAALSASTANVLVTYPGGTADSALHSSDYSVGFASARFSVSNLTISNISSAAGVNVGFAIDLDARKAWVRTDGTWCRGDPVAGTEPVITWSESFPVCITQRLYYTNNDCILNAGQEAFTYAVPTGFNEGWYE